MTFSYFRRDYKNLIWSDNLAIDPSDYTLFNVPSPLNNGETVTIYNLNPAKASAVNILDQNSSSNSRKYTGYDVSFQSRLNRLTMFGGVSVGHTVTNTCQVEDPELPAVLRSVAARTSRMYTQFKFNGWYMLPWAVQVSGTFQSYPGDARNSTVDGSTGAEQRHDSRGGSIAARHLERGPRRPSRPSPAGR